MMFLVNVTNLRTSADMVDEVAEWRGKLVEAVAEYDDELLERFFDDPDSITPEQLITVIRKAAIDLKIVPVMCGSAFRNKGVQRLLDGVIRFLPAPTDVPDIRGINPDTEKEEGREQTEEAPFTALAFKIATDPFVGRLAYIRVYSGKLDSGSYIYNTRSNRKERISRLYQMQSNRQVAIDSVSAGDICAGVGFKIFVQVILFAMKTIL